MYCIKLKKVVSLQSFLRGVFALIDGRVACLSADRLSLKLFEMWFVYVIYSDTSKQFYKGLTSDLDKRLEEHNKGYNKSAKAFAPWVLFFYEEFKTRVEARNREKYLKSGAGREYIKINGRVAQLDRASAF